MSIDRKSFCSKPFGSIFLGADGEIKTCCSANEPLGKLSENTIEEILDSDRAKTVRAGIISGVWDIDNCSTCINLESKGGTTERQGTNNDYEYGIYKDFTEDDFELNNIDLRWTNTCNLACNYCMPEFSNKWAKILGERVTKAKNTDGLLDYVEQNNKTLHSIMLLGGEPLLQKQNNRLLDIITPIGIILTNLSVPLETNTIAQKLIKTDINWGVSFENTTDRFEYVRHHASWELLDHNIDYIMKHVGRLEARPTYSLYSMTNLEEYYEYAVSKGISKISWSLIISPKQLSIMNFNKGIRDLARNEIDIIINKYGYDDQLIRGLSNIRNGLLEEHVDTSWSNKQFLEWSNKLETVWHPEKTTSFAELWPTIYKMIA